MKLKYISLFILCSISTGLFSQKKVVILHTNDTHSRIEPLPATDKSYPNTGGVVNRKAIIDSIRTIEPNVLLLDAGDFVQGTPYFNLFKGRVEAGAMNLMKYDAATIGNHEFDYGLDTMKMIFKRLDFPIVNCNYDFSRTTLKNEVKPYIILKRFGLKIGILGVGPQLEGLVQKDKYEGVVFNPIIPSVNKYAEILKKEKKCDLIICLSHVGYADTHAGDSEEHVVLDTEIAQNTNDVDIIIGGHSHTYMPAPDKVKNKTGKEVLVFQVGKNGSFIGKIDVELKKD